MLVCSQVTPAIRSARQRQQVWQRVRHRGASHGHRGVTNAGQSAAGECDRRTIYRQCAPGVLGSLLIFGERQLYRVIQAYVDYFNRSRPHQGIGQNVPCEPPANVTESAEGKINSLPVLNGLHHAYRRAA